MQNPPELNTDVDLSVLCMTPACHALSIEIACGPESAMDGGEVLCAVCGARYKLTVTRVAASIGRTARSTTPGTYLLLPTRVLRN